ncbi:collagen alpha-1(XVIII) chain-like [Latimeria chalumnae]|uniref:collagen alpha-1(XVIII) chain-like n=1 Tax=Latimeria chalumnae TaxID=7897 RepID=UPI00313A9CB3
MAVIGCLSAVLLGLAVCLSCADGQFFNWLWGGGSQVTTSSPPVVESMLEVGTPHPAGPEVGVGTVGAEESPTVPTGRLGEGGFWSYFGWKKQERTTRSPAMTSALPTPEKDKNIAGVGEQILNVAESIRNLVHRWDQQPTTTSTVGDYSVSPNTTSLRSGPETSKVVGGSPAEEGVSTSRSGKFGASSEESVLKPSAEGETTKPTLVRGTPQPGSSSPPVPFTGSLPNDSVTVVGSRPLESREQVGSPDPRNTASFHSSDASSEISVAPTAWVWQELAENAIVRDGNQSEVAGSSNFGLSQNALDIAHAVADHNDTRDLSNHTNSQLQPSFNTSKHHGIAMAELSRNESGLLSNTTVPDLVVGFTVLNDSEQIDFDLLITAEKSDPIIRSKDGSASIVVGMSLPASHCVPLPASLPFCAGLGVKSIALPNYLNQSGVVEIAETLREWAGLLGSHCHCRLEWFFCLLLAPRCNASAPPCRGFCENLRDDCWMQLDAGRLPVSCDLLPEEEVADGYSCVSINFTKGNPFWI